MNMWCVMKKVAYILSSRRRHTNWPRDWSSDVCSSDLPAAIRTWNGSALVAGPQRRGDLRGGGENSGIGSVAAPDRVPLARGLAQFLAEGRYIEVDLADAPLTVACLYLPKGGLPAELQRPGRMREAPDGGARYTRKMWRSEEHMSEL